ncbi:hypothetical protein D3H65_02310 [Paraflavitalea soli]|uniref:Uncharacterized protein n=1 Tax=Paraflavitalea soli TaxID=2315862 RepID=A0A3B7MEY3_9BACT|nr:hypothetical protein [Paraflavitalea soli]AXY72872.1 hypothetical protein D3H65_02310 [Paraflavitalea soli]
MKTASLSISNRLKGIISLFRSFESKPRYGTKQQSQAINNKEITDGTQAMNQVHAGHFLSGPHGIFNPQLI